MLVYNYQHTDSTKGRDIDSFDWEVGGLCCSDKGFRGQIFLAP